MGGARQRLTVSATRQRQTSEFKELQKKKTEPDSDDRHPARRKESDVSSHGRSGRLCDRTIHRLPDRLFHLVGH